MGLFRIIFMCTMVINLVAYTGAVTKGITLVILANLFVCISVMRYISLLEINKFYICIGTTWISHLSGTKTCSDTYPNMIISTKGVDEDTCKYNANQYPDANFLFWSNVYKENGNIRKSRCELFIACNTTRHIFASGTTYRMDKGR